MKEAWERRGLAEWRCDLARDQNTEENIMLITTTYVWRFFNTFLYTSISYSILFIIRRDIWREREITDLSSFAVSTWLKLDKEIYAAHDWLSSRISGDVAFSNECFIFKCTPIFGSQICSLLGACTNKSGKMSLRRKLRATFHIFTVEFVSNVCLYDRRLVKDILHLWICKIDVPSSVTSLD